MSSDSTGRRRMPLRRRCACASYGKGFTLLEMLLVVAFVSLLVAASAPLYSRLQGSTQLHEASRELAHTLHTARTRAVARFNDEAHGVYFEADRYTLYQGASYAARDSAYDRVVVFDSALTLSSSPSITTIHFSEGFGVPSATSTLTLTHNVYGTTTVSITALGTVQ